MTKEQYIKIREEGIYPPSLFYDYYVEKCPKPLVTSLEQFVATFGAYTITYTQQDIQLIVGKILYHFDEKFGVSLLFNNQGQLIKILCKN